MMSFLSINERVNKWGFLVVAGIFWTLSAQTQTAADSTNYAQ
ncbi:hypothetical protein [Spirosoma litoris]